MYSFKITAMGAPRVNYHSKYIDKRAQKYFAYCNHLKLLAKSNGFVLGDQLQIVFYLPMAKSWSTKERRAKQLTPHDQKPDIDNLVKGFMDAMKDGSGVDDCKVWYVHAMKFWTDEPIGSIVVEPVVLVDTNREVLHAQSPI